MEQDSFDGKDEIGFEEVDKFLLKMDANIMDKLSEVMKMIGENKNEGIKIHDKIHAAKDKIRELGDENQNLKKKETELTGDVDNLTNQNNELKEKIAHLTKEKSDMEMEWRAEKKKLTGEKEDLEGEKAYLTAQNQRLAEQKATLEGEVEKLTGQKKYLEKKNGDLAEENRKLEKARDDLQEEMPTVLRLREAYHEMVDLLITKGRTEGFTKSPFANLHMGPEGRFEDFLSKALDPKFPDWYWQDTDAFVAACQSGSAVAYETMVEVLSGLGLLLDAVFDLGGKSFMEKGICRLQTHEGDLLREKSCTYTNSGVPYGDKTIRKVWMDGIKDERTNQIYRSFVEGDW